MHEYIITNWHMLGAGLLETAHVVALSMLLAIPGGAIVGLARTCRWRPLRAASRAFLEFYRALPMPFLLLAGFFLWPQMTGIQVPGLVVAIGVFTIWGSVEIGESVRGALESLPLSQAESAQALGLGRWQAYRLVLMPQALPRMLPGTMNLLTRMVKTSCNVILVGVVDVVGKVQQINERTQQPMAGFLFLGICFFALCYPLSWGAKKLEHRWHLRSGAY